LSIVEHGREFWTYTFEERAGRHTITLIKGIYLGDGELIVNDFIWRIEEDLLFEKRESARDAAIQRMWKESGTYALLASLLDRDVDIDTVTVTKEQVERAVKNADIVTMRKIVSSTRGEA